MLAQLDVGNLWSHFVLGVLGVAYSRAIPEMIALQTRLNRIAVEWRAAAVGAIIGLLGWFAQT
jgi:H+/Cl- antiporter ClcA